MTNPNEKVWWMEDAYWFNDGAARFPKVASIVAEAERKGRVAAWEEARKMVQDHMKISGGRRDIDALRDIGEKMETKLALLTNKKEV
jgi:hypothetical protein